MLRFVSTKLFNLLTTTSSQSIARQALERQSFNPAFDYLESRAIVSETIHPEQTGRVRFQSTWWYAECPRNVVLFPDTPVRIVGRSNITFIVEPLLCAIP